MIRLLVFEISGGRLENERKSGSWKVGKVEEGKEGIVSWL